MTSKNKNFSDADFVNDLDSLMQKQEQDNPRLKRIHFQISPEGQKISKLIIQMLQAPDDQTETRLVEEIISHKEDALYPLMDHLLKFKNFGKKLADKIKK